MFMDKLFSAQPSAWRSLIGAAFVTVGGPLTAQVAEVDKLRNHHADTTLQITAENFGGMDVAWTINTDGPVSHRPLVVGDDVLFADWSGNAWSVDGETGEQNWKTKPAESVMTEWPWHGFTGTGAIGDGRYYIATVSGDAFALDAGTGETLWTASIAEDPHGGNVGDMLYWDGLLYIGLSSVEEPLSQMVDGFEVNFRGAVKALDGETGELVWELPLAVPPADGATVWSSFAIDRPSNTLFFTTSNNYTVANEFSDAMVAVDKDSGEIRWFDQVTNNDVWTMAEPKGPDYAFGAGPQLFETEIRGETVRLVGAGQKSGVFYVWDRATGERIWTTTVGYGHVGGGIHGEASVGEDRIIIWGNNAFPYANPEQHPMDIKAVDPATGDYLWVVPKAQPAVQISAGFLAGDVYFVGSLDGMVRAYDAQTGDKLWTSEAHGPVASSLWFENGMLFWGTGVPERFGGATDGYGVVAYDMSGQE